MVESDNKEQVFNPK